METHAKYSLIVPRLNLIGKIIVTFCLYLRTVVNSDIYFAVVLMLLQVCAHIVQAIRKETMRVREEWEISQAAGEAQEIQEHLGYVH